ncbi:MAG: hypothetical protein AABY07_10560 [Nanoarchaeota archaeon]|mgnify:CR=1 FL=1
MNKSTLEERTKDFGLSVKDILIPGGIARHFSRTFPKDDPLKYELMILTGILSQLTMYAIAGSTLYEGIKYGIEKLF